MSRLETARWRSRARDLYDTLTELVNAGALQQMPVGLSTRALDQLTQFAIDCHLDRSEDRND